MKGKTDLLDALIMQAIAKHASDVHFQEQQQPMFRLGLELYPCGYVEFNRQS